MAVAYSKKELREFAERWRGKGYEKGETQQFWLQALRAIGYPALHNWGCSWGLNPPVSRRQRVM